MSYFYSIYKPALVIREAYLFKCLNIYIPSSGRIDTAVWMHYMDVNQTYGEKS